MDKDMKIINDFPPNIEDLKTFFEITEHTVFTYGDILYVPDGSYIDDALLAHEETHQRQQDRMGIEKWWKLYMISADFRLSQEVEAYQNQYKVLKIKIRDRNKLNKVVQSLAKDLSSPLYGDIITRSKALKAITSPQPIVFDMEKVMHNFV